MTSEKAKSLHRIVLINIAQVEYANIKLDGNTCLIGKNNLGKTTLLRAILFFYNADSRRLGISTAKKSFEEYYFQYPNSYIIYEVGDGDTFFHIITYKKNTLEYRFVEGQYEKKMYFDEKGNALSISEIIKNLDISVPPIPYSVPVNTFKKYRDIIYGTEIDRNFKKFALLKGTDRYSNIPKAISDIFNSANSEIKAEFVKDFIAGSLTEQTAEIDLLQIKNQLKQFSDKFKDIADYHKPENTNRRQTIADTFEKIKLLKEKEKTLADTLGSALKYTAHKKQEIVQLIGQKNTEIQTIQDEIAQAEAQNREQTNLIREDIGQLKGYLKEIKTKKDEYEKNNIEDKIVKFNSKNDVLRTKEQLIHQKNELTSAFQDIDSIYKNIFGDLKNQKKEFDLEIKDLLNQTEARKQQEWQAQKDYFVSEENILRQKNAREIADVRVKIAELNGELKTWDTQTAQLLKAEPFADEINELKTQLTQNTALIKECEYQTEKLETELKILKENIEKTTTQAGIEYENFMAKNSQALQNANEKLQSLKHKINIKDDALYGFLDREYPDWQKHIGKVCNEEILFRTDLAPEIKSQMASYLTLYGVKINLNAIPHRVKQIHEYEQEKQLVAKEISDLVKELQAFQEEHKQKEKREGVKFAARKTEIEKELSQIRYKYGQAQLKQQQLQLAIDDRKEKAADEKRKLIAENDKKKAYLLTNIQNFEVKLAQLLETLDEQIEILQQSKQDKLQLLQQNYAVEMAKIEERRVAQYNQFATKEAELNAQKVKALKERNIDPSELLKIDEKIKASQQLLDEINQITPLVLAYQIDKNRLLDKQDEFERKLTALNQEYQKIEEEFKTTRKHWEKLINERVEERNELQKTANDYAKDLERYERFKLQLKPYLEIRINEATMRPIDEQIDILCDQLSANEREYLREREQFESYIRDFSGRFRENNHFGFHLDRNATEKEYNRFAEDLEKFVSQNTIATSIEEVAKNRSMLIDNIAGKVKDLTRQFGSIEAKINEMKKDFKKAEFEESKLIEYIDIRIIENESPLLKQLRKIFLFREEYGYAIGASTIFTDNKARSEVDKKSVELLEHLQKIIETNAQQEQIGLKDLFKLQFKIKEGQNVIDWTERLHDIGSEGTDILVKSVIFITIINAFIKEAVKKSTEPFKIHAMIDEVGKLSAPYLKELINFAEKRNIYLVNGLPNESKLETFYNYTYKLEKEASGNVLVRPLLTSVVLT
jgi:hypothetical protein